MRMPRISILMPSLNQGPYLAEAIESVLNQSYPNKELIIIDGGSTDGSVEIIKQYEEHLAYWVSEKDRGQSHAIRKGVARSSGEWLNWINSDDALLPGALAAIARAAKRHADAEIVVGCGLVGDQYGRFIRAVIPVSPRLWMPKHLCYGPYCQQATFWTRKAYESVGGINETLFFRMDIDLLERMLLRGNRAITIEHSIAFFRIHLNTKSCLKQDVRRTEFDSKVSELGITRIERWLALNAIRVYRLVSGNYLRYRLANALIRGESLSGCWKKALASAVCGNSICAK